MRRILSLVLTFCMVFTLLPAIEVSAADAVSDSSVFLKQNTNYTCTLSSAAMMLRRRAYLEGNSNWNSITENSLKSTAWAGGLRWSFKYAGMSVESGSFKGMTQAQKKSQIISLLNQHPEGIVIYMYGNGNKTHAVLATDYDTYSGTLYCADPANGIEKGRIPLMSAHLSGSTQDARIGNMRMYWYVKSGNCTLTTPIVTPPVHTHSYTYTKEDAHPHYDYKSCSCGDIEYTGATNLVAACSKCYPIGSISLRRSFEKTEGTATFYRNDVRNVTSYSLALYRNDSLYDTYDMSSDEKQITGLPSGAYTATLTVKNSVTGEARSASCNSFKIADSYIITYNANGGSREPSADEKIQDTPKTLSSKIPQRTGYVFLGWARSKKATTAEYQPGDSFTKNTSLTLYAVWEPETYTITYNANGGKGELENVTVTYGDTVRMPNTVVRDGYYLKGWATSASASTVDYKLGIDHEIKENCTLYAVWGSSTWGGDVSTSLKGSGTEEDPYQIATAADLAYLANKVNSQTVAPTYEYYIMTDNIQLGYAENEKWVPIGLMANDYQYFEGSFDGNGYTISDMYITDAQINETDNYEYTGNAYVGLFGNVSGDVKNLSVTGAIENINLTTDGYVYIGGIAGSGYRFKNCTLKYFSISNIKISTCTMPLNYCYVGGIVGEGNYIKDCKALECHISTIESGVVNAGLICGASSNFISDCNVKSTQDSLFSGKITGNVGGLCGYQDCEMVNCIVDAPCLTKNFSSDGKNIRSLGGISGYASGGIKACSVNFSSDKYENSIETLSPCVRYVGGIAGDCRKNAAMQDCIYNGETIEINNDSDVNVYLGGIAGYGRNSVSRCIANIKGDLSCNSKTYGYVGGIVGGSSAGNISNVLMIADIISSNASTDARTGCIVAELSGDVTIENAYYSSDISIESSTDTVNTSGTPRSTRLLTIPSFLTGNLGFGQYTSLANLEENPDAVWVIKDGELPQLYHTCLNDITVSDDIANGTVTVDKAQAVDGEIVNVTATPADGYILNKIYVNGEEAVGETFVVEGNSVVYATFAEEIPEYEVSITNDENASGTLTNADESSGSVMSLMSLASSGDTELVANDGEEISVDVTANSDYTVDTLYVNGEEIAGTSFILTEDTVVTMDVTNISTDIIAITNDAELVSDYGAVLSGSVSGNAEGITKYIRYWKADDESTVYTTEVQEGIGDYTAEIIGLQAETTYYYQMTEYGEVKSFTTCAAPYDENYVEGGETENPETGSGEDNEDGESDDPVDENATLISANTVTARAGATVDVAVSIKNNPGIAFLNFKIGYDSSAMTLQSVAVNDVFEAGDVIAGNLSKNPYTFLATKYNGNAAADGDLLTLTFLVSENCEEGDYAITLTDAEGNNIDEADVAVELTNGVVSVTNAIPGDINGDGSVNGKDLTRLGKYFAGWDVAIDEAASDVTGDGAVNGKDLTRLGKYFAGWDVNLG